MKKSELQQIIREEIQNALTEAIMVGWNGYEQKPIKIEPTKEKDGINITNEDNPGQMWFVPSDQIPELVGYLQGLNLQPFKTGDAELNPGLVRMVNKLKKQQKSLNEEGRLLNPQLNSNTSVRSKEYLDKLKQGKKGDRIKMIGRIFNKEINNFDKYFYEITLIEPFKRDPQRRSQYYAPADYKGEKIVIRLSYGDDDIQLFKNGKMWTPHTGETSVEDFVKNLQKSNPNYPITKL